MAEEKIVTPPVDPPAGADPPGTDPPKTIEVPVDYFANLNKTLENISQKLDFNAAPKPEPPPPPPDIPDVSDEDYYGAIAAANTTGNYAEVQRMDGIRRSAEKERTVRQITDQFNPQLAQGANAISQLSSHVVRQEMPYYDDLKEEIEAELDKATPQQRMNPDLQRAAYHYVVGKNADKVIDLEMQRRLRKQETIIPGTPGTGVGSRAAEGAAVGAEDVPDYTKVLKPDSVDALRAVGKDGDAYARSLGYKDWPDYYTNSYKPFYLGEEGGAA